MEKKRLNKTEEEKRKWKIIKIIGGSLFLTAGAIFGIVFLYMNGWNFIELIKNPTADLVMLCVLAIGITIFGTLEVK